MEKKQPKKKKHTAPLFIPTPRRKVLINDNVISILQEVDYHKFMRTYHITASFPTRGRNGLYDQLNRLFHQGYLGRATEFDYREHRYAGSLPFFYWIRPAGKYELAKRDLPYTGDIDYDPKAPDRRNLDHDLATTAFMVKAKMYALMHRLRFIPHYDIKSKGDPKHPFKFQVKGVYNGKFYDMLFCEPDKVFGIERSDGKKSYFFLETDMGVGQPLSRATPFTSSIRKKHVCYDLVFKANLHKLQLNIPNGSCQSVTNTTSSSFSCFIKFFARRIFKSSCAAPVILMTGNESTTPSSSA